MTFGQHSFLEQRRELSIWKSSQHSFRSILTYNHLEKANLIPLVKWIKNNFYTFRISVMCATSGKSKHNVAITKKIMKPSTTKRHTKMSVQTSINITPTSMVSLRRAHSDRSIFNVKFRKRSYSSSFFITHKLHNYARVLKIFDDVFINSTINVIARITEMDL